nr:daylily invertase inhibitor [Hemerocallis fulva]
MKPCLKDCLQLYSMSVSRLSDSANAINDGRYDDANVWISSALDTSFTCEGGFKELKVKSPLTKENDEFTSHVSIALAITAMLEGRRN